MGKGTVRIYKYDQQKRPYPYPNTVFVIPPCFDTSLQTQLNISYDASMGENDLASAILY